MNKAQIELWIREAKYVTHSFFEYDESGNKRETRIFEKDGQLYALSFCNGYISAKMGEKGLESERDDKGARIKDKNGELIYIYEPIPVRKETKMVEVTEYVQIEKTT